MPVQCPQHALFGYRIVPPVELHWHWMPILPLESLFLLSYGGFIPPQYHQFLPNVQRRGYCVCSFSHGIRHLNAVLPASSCPPDVTCPTCQRRLPLFRPPRHMSFSFLSTLPPSRDERLVVFFFEMPSCFSFWLNNMTRMSSLYWLKAEQLYAWVFTKRRRLSFFIDCSRFDRRRILVYGYIHNTRLSHIDRCLFATHVWVFFSSPPHICRLSSSKHFPFHYRLLYIFSMVRLGRAMSPFGLHV